MTYYPSRSAGPLGHQVIRTETGRYSCSCESRSECWAIQKEKAKDKIEKITGRKEPVIEIPDKQVLIEQQLTYLRSQPVYNVTADDIRRSEQATQELWRASKASFEQKKLAAYYLRFLP